MKKEKRIKELLKKKKDKNFEEIIKRVNKYPPKGFQYSQTFEFEYKTSA